MSDSKGLGHRAFHVATPQHGDAKTCKCEGVVERAVAYLATHYLVSQSVVFAGASGKCKRMKRRGPDAPSGIPPI